MSPAGIRDQRPAQGNDLFRQPRVLLWIRHIDTGTKNSHRFALGRDRASMGGRVYTACHAALDNQTAGGEINSKTLRHAGTIWCRVARADNSDPRLPEDVNCPAHVENQRRIVNLFQTRRVRRIVKRDQLNAGGRCSRHLLLRQLHRFSSAERLRRNG